jgi:hypothetical protein
MVDAWADLAADELPKVAVISAEVLPGASSIPVEASEPELQALVD